MILYNVTYGIDKEIEGDWINWMKGFHIPALINTGLFTDFKFYKVLSHEDEGSSSYCIQYFSPDITLFNQYLEKFASGHMDEIRQRFKDRHVAFNTLLEEVL